MVTMINVTNTVLYLLFSMVTIFTIITAITVIIMVAIVTVHVFMICCFRNFVVVCIGLRLCYTYILATHPLYINYLTHSKKFKNSCKNLMTRCWLVDGGRQRKILKKSTI